MDKKDLQNKLNELEKEENLLKDEKQIQELTLTKDLQISQMELLLTQSETEFTKK